MINKHGAYSLTEPVLFAFNNSIKLKQEIILQLEAHYKNDEIVKGQYWKNGKGCAVGCITHSDSSSGFEKLGIPIWVQDVIDSLFEWMPLPNAKEFPLKLIKSIPAGFSDWNTLYQRFAVFILEDVVIHDSKDVQKLVRDAIALHNEESRDLKKHNMLELIIPTLIHNDSSARNACYAVRFLAKHYVSHNFITTAIQYALDSKQEHIERVSVDAFKSKIHRQGFSSYIISEMFIALLRETYD